MNKLHVGAFYTEETPYEGVIRDYLIPSCEKLGIIPNIVTTRNQGSWLKNVAEKPRAIVTLLQKCCKEREDILLFLDADSTLEAYPTEIADLPDEYELGYHTLNWNQWYGYNHVPCVKELLTGTMIFRNTANIQALCQEWYELAKTTPIWEQKVLAQIISKYSQIKTYHLGIEYCYMTSLPDGREPRVQCQPVVKHYQASRTLKREIL